MNRRQFVIASGASLLTSAFLRLCAQMPAPAHLDRSYAEEMPDMLVSYLVSDLNQLASSWDHRRALLQTAEGVGERNRAVREKLLSMLGEFPPKTPLHVVTVTSAEKDGYRVENVMFQSRPDFWVTGNLYVPANGSGRFPAIISPCGHYPLARMTPQYQNAYISLVKSGFVVLSYDPIGQGERRQYWNPATGITDVGGPVFEHSMAGQLLLLLGDNLTNYLVWDGMRAIDYLLTRPEVDPDRIGCAGHSGGGTLTKFIAVADPRVQCAAILEGGTANQWPARSIGIADVEQNLFPAALNGIDNVDLHAAIAPRPLLAGIESYNVGFNSAADAIRLRYKQLGAEEKFDTVAADDPHAWTPKLRRATTDWFCRWFYGRNGLQEEAAFETSRPEDLYCTPNGSLLYSRKGATIFSIISAKAADLPPRQRALNTDADLAGHRRQVRERLGSLLRYQEQRKPLDLRRIATTPREGYRIEKIEFLSEPGIYIPAWVFVPDGPNQTSPAVLYLNDEGVQSDGMEFEGPESSGLMHGVLDQLVRSGRIIIAADVRGIGATHSAHGSSLSEGEFGQLFDMDTSMAYAAWSMDRSLLGMRVRDVVRCVDYVMQREGIDKQRFHVIGKGRAGLWCLYAAALDERIPTLICAESLLSYRSLAQSDRYLYGADIFVPGILQYLDLPEIATAIAPRPLIFVKPKDAMKRDVDSKTAEETYRWTQTAYQATDAKPNFQIECEGGDLGRAEHYLNLMQTMERRGLSSTKGTMK
ncbi:MAG TPA: alpha/beta hydrolase family protein [Terracidiphilus sp.]|nr:alpha/beta hydrolase family protein [Terracidiphilus sp.]